MRPCRHWVTVKHFITTIVPLLLLAHPGCHVDIDVERPSEESSSGEEPSTTTDGTSSSSSSSSEDTSTGEPPPYCYIDISTDLCGCEIDGVYVEGVDPENCPCMLGEEGFCFCGSGCPYGEEPCNSISGGSWCEEPPTCAVDVGPLGEERCECDGQPSDPAVCGCAFDRQGQCLCPDGIHSPLACGWPCETDVESGACLCGGIEAPGNFCA